MNPRLPVRPRRCHRHLQGPHRGAATKQPSGSGPRGPIYLSASWNKTEALGLARGAHPHAHQEAGSQTEGAPQHRRRKRL